MPNRIIKESICTSRKINTLAAEEEVFFYRLLVNCDDFGCFFGDTDVLRGKLYPRRKMTDAKIAKLRDAVVDAGLAFLYEDNGETYICVNLWDIHQRIRSKNRKYPEPTPKNIKKGVTPSYVSNLPSNDSNSPQNAAYARGRLRVGLDSSSLNNNNLEIDKEDVENITRAREESGKVAASEKPGPEKGMDTFDMFWEEYPRKVGKGAARKAWAKIKPSSALTAQMIEAVRRAKGSRDWMKDSGQYIPNPATWLNQNRWEDEPPEPVSTPPAANGRKKTATEIVSEMREKGMIS